MNIAIAMTIGFVGTSVIHISKGMMKLGISRMRAGRAGDGGVRRVSIVYIAGMFANFTTPFWVMPANLFAPTVFYTSMYGTGLVAGATLIQSAPHLDHALTATPTRHSVLDGGAAPFR